VVVIFVLIFVLVGVMVFFVCSDSEKRGVLAVNFSGSQKESLYSLRFGSQLGRVVDQQGDGVAGATVTFTKHLNQGCQGHPAEEPPAWHGTFVLTNEKGEFVYPPEIWSNEEDKNKHSIRMDIEAEGFLTRTAVYVGINYGDDTGEIDLFRIGRIEGVIIDPNGEPVGNVPIRLDTQIQYKCPNESCVGCFNTDTVTSKLGEFVFEKVPPGLHVVKFPGYAGGCGEDKPMIIPFEDYAAFQTVQIADGAVVSNVFLDLRQSQVTIKGKVVDKAGHPMAGVYAHVYMINKLHTEHGGLTGSSHIKRALSNENGDYILKYIPIGDYQLQAQYPYEKGKNYKSGDAINIYLSGSQEVSFNLVLERQDGSLPRSDNCEQLLFEVSLPEDLGPREMMIVDQKGNGISDAKVVFSDMIRIEDRETHQRTEKNWAGATLITNSQGCFNLPDAIKDIEGERTLCHTTIEAEGFEKRDREIGSYYLEDERRIDLLPIGSIHGRVIGEDGKPVQSDVSLDRSMVAYKNPGDSIGYGGWGYMRTIDGEFMFNDVPQGSHVIGYTVFDSERKKERKGKFIVYTHDGKNIDNLVIDLRKDTCAVCGQVLNWDGEPVKKASVKLIKKMSWGNQGSTTTTWEEFYRSKATNQKGHYAIEHIRPGVYEIEGVLEGKKQQTSEKMTIAVADGQTIELDVRLKR